MHDDSSVGIVRGTDRSPSTQHGSSLLSIQRDSIFAWTDSRVVLGCLRGDSRRFRTFVGNRVSEVLELTPPNMWRHVSGKDNPADCASQGLYPAELADHHQWWQGPGWLRQPVTRWPATNEHSLVYNASEERTTNPNLVVLHMSIQSQALPLLPRISSYSRLIRVTAWILRFIYIRNDNKER